MSQNTMQGVDVKLISLSPCNNTTQTSEECLLMSERAEAEILFKSISGSCTARTSRGTHPLSTTACDNSASHMIIT